MSYTASEIIKLSECADSEAIRWRMVTSEGTKSDWERNSKIQARQYTRNYHSFILLKAPGVEEEFCVLQVVLRLPPKPPAWTPYRTCDAVD